MNMRVRLATWLIGSVVLATSMAQAEQQVLRLKLDGAIGEAPSEDGELALLFGGSAPKTLRSLVNKIHDAAADDDIAGIAMIVDSPAAGMAQIQELREALQKFRATGKKIHCYMEWAGNGGYALATAADHITLAEYSELAIMGLRAELSFYKGMFDKIGVQADMLHCGDYKSALEPYTRTEPSEAAAANLNWLLDGIYDGWVGMIAQGRNQSPSQIKAAVDQAPIGADQALERKLIDAVGSFEDFRKMIRKEYGQDVQILTKYPKDDDLEFDIDPANPFAFFNEMNRVMEELFGEKEEPDEPGVGLIYIEGGIVMGKSQSSPFGGAVAGATTVRNAFEAATDDDNVKVVVVRVDSPGGSALASDIMWNAAMECAEKKPVIVSMGGVAGSGGYYVAIPGEVIFADEMTITGSIGVVGGKIVVGDLFEDKLGITTTEFQRGASAGLMSVNRPWNDSERERMQGYLNDVYDQFKGRVMHNRGSKLKKDIEELAGGRVFTGSQALELGLVDKLGSLDDALQYAEKRVNLDDAPVYVFPKPKDFAEVLAMLMGEETNDGWQISVPRQLASDPLLGSVGPLLNGLAPQHVKRIISDLQNLAILNQERVGCFMPAIRIR